VASLKITTALVWTAFALAGCGGDGGSSQTLPTLSSTVADCDSVAGPCAQLDLALGGHVISPLLFGDGIHHSASGFGTTISVPRHTVVRIRVR